MDPIVAQAHPGYSTAECLHYGDKATMAAFSTFERHNFQ